MITKPNFHPIQFVTSYDRIHKKAYLNSNLSRERYNRNRNLDCNITINENLKITMENTQDSNSLREINTPMKPKNENDF